MSRDGYGSASSRETRHERFLRSHKATVEHRLGRVKALMVAMQAIAVAGDDFPGRGNACTHLEIMAADEMAKVFAVLGTEVLNRDCYVRLPL